MSRSSLLWGLALVLFCSSAVFSVDFEYTDFTNTNGLTLVGNTIVSGFYLQLTAAINTQTGAVWTNEQYDVADGFSTTFEFQINPPTGGADGMTFILQSNSPTELRTGGGGLGYDGMPNSIVLEIDHYNNGNHADPNGNHLSLHAVLGGPNTANESASIGIASSIPNLGGIHTIQIDYDGVGMVISLDGAQLFSSTVDAAAHLGGTSAHLGFTGATGGLNEQHLLRSWSFESQGEFQRGDANADGSMTLEDALDVAVSLFVSPFTPVECLDAGDADDNGLLSIADSIWILGTLFTTVFPPITAPYPNCGIDSTSDSLNCSSTQCP